METGKTTRQAVPCKFNMTDITMPGLFADRYYRKVILPAVLINIMLASHDPWDRANSISRHVSLSAESNRAAGIIFILAVGQKLAGAPHKYTLCFTKL